MRLTEISTNKHISKLDWKAFFSLIIEILYFGNQKRYNFRLKFYSLTTDTLKFMMNL